MRGFTVFFLVSLGACAKHEQAPEQRTAAKAQSLNAPKALNPLPSGTAVAPVTSVDFAAGRGAQSAEECHRACNGEWKAHGIKQQLYCLCRTQDANEDCEDGSDCEGQCLLREVRTHVVEPGPPARGYFVGKCSEFVTAIGCVRRISRGTKQLGPVKLDEPPFALCVD